MPSFWTRNEYSAPERGAPAVVSVLVRRSVQPLGAVKIAARLLLIACVCGVCLVQSRKFPQPAPQPDRTGDKPTAGAAMQFFYGQRAQSGSSVQGYIADYRRMQAMRATEDTLTAWSFLGPANYPGRVLSLAINHDNTNEVWCGTASGGLWKLFDYDTAYVWQPVETGYPVLAVNTIYVDSANTDLVFIGTGEIYSFGTGMPSLGLRTNRGLYGIGILFTTDDGATWSQSAGFPAPSDTSTSANLFTGVNKIIANPRYTRSMYAATSQGLYKSYDQGHTWVLKSPVVMAMDIAINRIDTNLLYASFGDFGGQTTGIYRSTNAGESWFQVAAGLPGTFTGLASLSIYPFKPNILVAGISNEFATQGIYETVDSGKTWQLQNDTDYCGLQGWYTNVVEINPFFFNEIIFAGVNLWSSFTGGINPTLNANSYHVDIHAIEFHPDNMGTYYLATDGGVYKTTDDGGTFTPMNEGLTTTQFYNRISNSANDTSLILGGTQDNGTLLYSGKPDWTQVLEGDGSWSVISEDTAAIMVYQYEDLTAQYPVNAGAYFSRSTNSGQSAATIFSPPTTLNQPYAFTTPVIQAPSDPNVMFIGVSELYKSTDKGIHWSAANGDAELDPGAPDANPCISLSVSHATADTLYALTAAINHKAGAFVSTDGGNSFTRVTPDTFPNRFATDVAVDPHNAAIAYVTFSGFGGEHVFMTTNTGATWSDITANLPDVPADCVLPDPVNSQYVYVGTDFGAFETTNGGVSWQSYMNGMPTAIVMSLAYCAANNSIRAATHGRGVFERVRNVPPPSSVAETPAKATATFAVYPTIISSQTASINVSLSHELQSGNSTLVLYDVSGRMIEKRNVLAVPAGVIAMPIPATLPSGMYYVALRAESGVSAKKILVMK